MFDCSLKSDALNSPILKIKALYPLMDDVTRTMVTYLREEIKKKAVSGLLVKEICAKFTTDVVSSCIFAIDANSFSATADEAVIRKMGKSMMETSLWNIILITLTNVFPVISKLYKVPLISKKHEKFFIKIMADAVAHRAENRIDRKDYLDHLMNLKEKKGISALDMAAHAITFFLDGFETTGVVMSQALYVIAAHKKCQNRMRQEISENLDTDGNISFEKLQELPYLEQVFCETLRLYPPGLSLVKKCTEPIELDGFKGHKLWVTKGTLMWIPIYSLHRDAENWPHPNEFDPDRFADGAAKSFEDKGIYLPFGNGPRICLGRRFANTQVKKGIVEILKNFEISVNPQTIEPITLDPKSNISPGFMFEPKGGVWLDFKAL